MADHPVKHWIVAASTVGETPAIGTVSATMHASLKAANDAAKLLAASNPGTFYVVYEAQWYAYVDITPVALTKVGAL